MPPPACGLSRGERPARGSGASGSAAHTTLGERGEKLKRVAKLKCHLKHGSLQVRKTAPPAHRGEGAGQPLAALWFGGGRVAITEVMNVLPPKPSPRGLRVTQPGNSKPSDGARKNLPCWLTPQAPTSSWGERTELAARLAHLRSPGKVEAKGTHPSGKGLRAQGPFLCQSRRTPAAKGSRATRGLSWLGRCSAWRCRTQTCHRAALCRPCFGSSGQKPELLNPQAGKLLLGNPKALWALPALTFPQRQGSYWRPKVCLHLRAWLDKGHRCFHRGLLLAAGSCRPPPPKALIPSPRWTGAMTRGTLSKPRRGGVAR